MIIGTFVHLFHSKCGCLQHNRWRLKQWGYFVLGVNVSVFDIFVKLPHLL